MFMSPETATTNPWRGIFKEKINLACVCVDEAHCIFEWFVVLCVARCSTCMHSHLCHDCRGESFRKAFRNLGGLRALTGVPFSAMTASAPPHIEAEIVSSLELNNPVHISLPLDRSNIFHSVSEKLSLSVSAKVMHKGCL